MGCPYEDMERASWYLREPPLPQKLTAGLRRVHMNRITAVLMLMTKVGTDGWGRYLT